MTPIPQELVEQIERNNVILVLGDDITSGETGLPTLSQLAQGLAQRSHYSDPMVIFDRVAQHYELEFGSHALISYIKERLQAPTFAPLTAHHILARLPFPVFLTTCLDNRLEQALQQINRPFTSIVRNSDVAYEDEDKLLVVKMYGDISQPDTLVLTEMDHQRLLSEVSTISDVLNRLIASRTLLMLGIDLDDHNFRNVYDRVTRRLDRHARRSYAFYRQASTYAINYWEKLHNVRVRQTEPLSFLRQLEQELQRRQKKPVKRKGGKITSGPPPSIEPSRRPYKFLNSYEQEDVALFCGRDREISQLLSKIVAYRLVLLYGKSGVGKTSLIQAGLIPILTASGYYPIYTRPLNNPLVEIPRTVKANLKLAAPEQLTLESCLQQAGELIEKPLVLFIDQFEELFTQVEPKILAEFIKSLGSIYADSNLKLKIVFSFREDFLAELNVFVKYIPTIFTNYCRLEQMTLPQAKEAIIRPAELCGLTYETDLVERLLADLGNNKIDPPQLQIVCDSLYESLSPDETMIGHHHYEQLGGASLILNNYLDQVLNRYVNEQRLIVQAILKAFISSSDTKMVLTINSLAQRTKLSVEQAQKTINELLETRLVRRAESETQYELAHEYLVSRIVTWMSSQERAQQRAHEMLEQGLIKWQRFGLPLYWDEMAIVDAQRETLELSEEVKTLLIRSSVLSGYNPDYWIGCAPAPVRVMVLSEAMKNDDAACRQRAVRLAGHFAVSDLIKSLSDLMINDPESMVRCQAALSLAQLDSAYFIACLQTMFKTSPRQDQLAVEAIDYVQKAGLAAVEFNQLRGVNLRWRLGRLRVQRNHQLWRAFALYGLFGGLAGGMLGGLLGSLFFSSGLVVSVGMVIAGSVGMVTGLGSGAGFGLARAMQEPRHSIVYIMSTMLGGAITGALAGMGAIATLSKFLSGVGLGVMGGGLAGVVLALIINLTVPIASLNHRLLTRAVLALIGGAITGGAMLALAAQLELGPPGLQPLGGFLIGVFNSVGVVVGLELAERRFDKIT